MESDWAAKRRAAARVHEAALAQAQAAESAQARSLLADFVAKVKALGIAPERLEATGYSGGRPYKTDVVGWYLRSNRTVATDPEGRYFVLQTPGGWAARFTGVRLTPEEPPLTVGRGGRDGEAIDLKDLLALRLAELTAANG
ncbi:MAG: hypothetical protein LBI84_04225 [Propionibacteriaceae bacterium]|jgi:hypothetical protein|nr:hypothetical protein [Propionibacteriaceae bacterium]